MTPETNARIRLAVELRAAGATWEAVGQCLGRDPSTCRRWPSRYRVEWDCLEQAARDSVGLPTSDRDVRSCDPGLSQDVAECGAKQKILNPPCRFAPDSNRALSRSVPALAERPCGLLDFAIIPLVLVAALVENP